MEQQGHPRPSRAWLDVTVIGAGPAGALLAYLLARRGLRVAVAEKAHLPRVKPCGGGLNQKTVALLPFAIDAVVERTVSRLVFTQNLQRPFARTYPQPLVSLVTRCRFDHFLVQQATAAGARLYEGCRVTSIVEQPRGFTIHGEGVAWSSRYLAFADGARGTLRRQLGFTALSSYDTGLDMDVQAGPECPWTPDTVYIDWGSRARSYAWAFPKAEHWSIGVKGPAAPARALSHYLDRFMQRWRLVPGRGAPRYLAHLMPTRMPGMPLVRGRALVLGDAAGLLEPFTGEGIYYAVRSAQLAAPALAAASASDSSPLAYEVAVDTEIMPELTGAGALQRLFDAYPFLFHLLMRYRRRYWHVLAHILRGERSFAQVEGVLRRHPCLVRLALWPTRTGAEAPVGAFRDGD